MIRVASKDPSTCIRSRLALFHGTSVNAERACGYDENEITYQLLLESGVKALNLFAAGVGPQMLVKIGSTGASDLRKFGFDALHLTDGEFCNECSTVYGRDDVVDAFLVSASDAVALSGSEAMHILGVIPVLLLEKCAGFPGEAIAVLEQLPRGAALAGVPAAVILDAGLRADSLKSVGYGLASVVNQTEATGNDLFKLGFKF